ncbi:ABC transporter substrate-binding protein [Pollutimonas bauzanensis]|uniref:Amino acid/amide ABC transporter substrate-binding protein, HAAT family (TC 3.A.1.4.-) n=1 Tax=Pollutimonas bauzanensis TaxID=658167 RepID=A0A1M5YQ55_9BURK|nr:ABC transporter substrate-binding protein [Pollutimonas bauzanensis]SHI14019.1 amino acid/amide ABC transporter substrate-binding protein, HAAT family (TC 3.A.1.4.-) [Pollutimonas bauzanensis]
MESQTTSAPVSRRAVLQLAAAAGIAQLAPPFIIQARGEQPVKLGLDNPLTGTYAATGKNEQTGCQLAIEQINAKGGILGRPAELLSEDSSSGDAGTAVQKARKLIDRDKVSFLLGNVNSGLSLAMAQVSSEKGVLHVVPGGHTDAITGTTCHWNVFRVCNTTRMLTNAIAKSLMDRYGKKMYFITSDYAFGHTLQDGYDANLKQYGGAKLGEDLTPLGTTDFSSYLIKAQATGPDVIVFLMNGDDLLNALKQAVQFGLDKRFHLAGANTELEVLEGLPPEARIGDWDAEWYHIQPGVPHVDEFVAAIKKKTGRVPTARTWFGFVGAWTCALAANQAKSLDAVKMARALQGMHLPPEVGLMPNAPFYRAGQNQLIGSIFVGHAQAQGSQPDDLFHVDKVVDGAEMAGTVQESGCKMTWPA